jgi:predicted lipid-binding transport protein (Tim44 family)
MADFRQLGDTTALTLRVVGARHTPYDNAYQDQDAQYTPAPRPAGRPAGELLAFIMGSGMLTFLAVLILGLGIGGIETAIESIRQAAIIAAVATLALSLAGDEEDAALALAESS